MIQFAVIFLLVFALSVALAWCWGYLIGAGLAYMGVIQDPTIVAWSFAAISAASLLLKVLASRRN